LAAAILRAPAQERTDVAARCYRIFYRELPWLNDTKAFEAPEPIEEREATVFNCIGHPPASILEIGAGNGELIQCLARRGYSCLATDINPVRFKKSTYGTGRIRWEQSDGIRFSFHLPREGFDWVLSLNVIEHFHPKDMALHFRNVCSVLKPGGRYLFKTPHGTFGPHGIEKVFSVNDWKGFHLKEYSHHELRALATAAGFRRYFAIPTIPRPLRGLGLRNAFGLAKPSVFYADYLCHIERMLLSVPAGKQRNRSAKAARFLLFPRQVFGLAAK
jgi:SAM-dependent methyltransferase